MEKVDIQIGDKITYKYINTIDKKEITRIVIDENEIKDYINMSSNIDKEFSIEILKIERPKYEVIEEKKELLTEEEREFLKRVISLNKNIKIIRRGGSSLYFYEDIRDGWGVIYVDKKFKKLKQGQDYTLQDLGLED